MTAVASPPSVQSGPRLGWYSSGNGGQGALSSMNDEVSRMFMPRKNVQRSNSSSSLSSTSSTSSSSTIQSSHHQDTNAAQSNHDWSLNTSGSKRKPRSLLPPSKAEPVSGVTTARSQAVPALSSSGLTASSTMSAIHQSPSIVPSQHLLQSSQQNGIRQSNGPSAEPPAILTLLPINATFDKKQINVPYYPDVLRVGRQTNAKTIPTTVNGFFDSKVLSRQHAEIWADKTGKIWIRDVKSSNGTFVNGQRLSPESRESEPHELRENDTLELGIDIVSEDQKTIVHHKVSAKVEHAGIYGTSPNILDLNFGDLDPSAGGGLLPPPLSQPLSHFRGRAGSAASNRSVQSSASSQINAMHQQRQMNYWNSPITIEQVVKRLTNEMKQAKQQAQDLRQTDEFLTTLTKSGGLEKEKPKHSPLESNGPRLMNGRPKMPRVDSMSRFSDPPAPPPQQPLPEKPDAAMSPLKRSDTEKPKLGANGSPVTPVTRESSQILSLIEALSSAKRELDTQGARVKELENMLRLERLARENAEERARQLEVQPESEGETGSKAVPELPADMEKVNGVQAQPHDETLQPNGAIEPAELVEQPIEPNGVDLVAEAEAKKLQYRLETMMEEMQEIKQQVEEFKKRAQTAEEETIQARKSLAEMIETLRQERAQRTETASKELPAGSTETDEVESEPSQTVSRDLTQQQNGNDLVADTDYSVKLSSDDMDDAITTLATHKHTLLEQSSPYASMLGVVLLGVGLMAYLNGWQKLDK
ncbi:hypothetical protein ASPZODRAFT_138470 [Penicilliopsis zonata CBS 506.65]|uniref:FHA domain-containing protein n=1 Tax=Penicilliopsis zonata CBS 506.65 TaxID=1073090 RepID=A0A1L9SW01_9EURO|nr:hypothetical protein ASPZODRAFT_138470 [Penicilliopsis zonata CBS 506.65]OJJ51368.1 hypothetical protein ASPZODRAFT_138470 [Penicilliopsis zonata CBS 506.65]